MQIQTAIEILIQTAIHIEIEAALLAIEIQIQTAMQIMRIHIGSAYLIIVTTTITGGSVSFSTENAKWTAFRKVYSGNKNTNYGKNI